MVLPSIVTLCKSHDDYETYSKMYIQEEWLHQEVGAPSGKVGAGGQRADPEEYGECSGRPASILRRHLPHLFHLPPFSLRTENPARKHYWPFWSKDPFPSVTLKAKYVLLCWSSLLPAMMMNAERGPSSLGAALHSWWLGQDLNSHTS